MAACLNEEFFASDSVIIRKGELGNTFYIIKSGKAKVVRDGKELAVLESAGYFGDISLLENTKRNAGITMIITLS